MIQVAGKQKVEWWEVEFGDWLGGNGTVKGSNFSAHRGLKNGGFYIENLWYVIVWLFVHMYRHFEIVVLQCVELNLVYEFAMFTSAKLLKFRGTSDSGWLRFKLGGCGAVGNVFVLLCDSSYVFGVVDNFVLSSFICASETVLFIDVENIPKNPAKSMRATLACLLTCVWTAHVFWIPFNKKKYKSNKIEHCV